MQHEITNRIHAEHIHQIIRIDDISLGFAHLAIALQQPRMSEYLLGQRQIQCHEENRPVDRMETDDVLADQVQICGPVLLKLLRVVAVTVIADTGDIVGQSIQPYIHHVLRIEVHRNAPGKGRSGYAQILQARQKEVVHHLIFAGHRLNKLRMGVDVLDEAVCVFAHTEEISLFSCRLYLSAAVRAFTVHQLRLCEKGLAGRTVHALIIALVNIAFVVQFFEDLLYLFLMIIVRGADEFIIGSIHQIPDPLDLACRIIHKLLGCHACGLCLQLDLLAVLVGSCLEKYVIALLSLESGNAVCQHNLVGIANVRLAGRIGNGGGHIKLLLIHVHLSSSSSFTGIHFP